MFKSAAYLFIGNIVLALATFARSVIAARLLTVEDFGIAATLSIFLNLILVGFGLGFTQYLVQNKNGDEPGFMESLHSLQLFVGVLMMIVLIIIAYPYAWAINMQEYIWAFQLMSLGGLAFGLTNLDIHRRQRHGEFLPTSMENALPMVISVVVLYPFFLLFGDFRAMLAALLVQILSRILYTHIMAKRPYRFERKKDVLRGALIFGAPLLINSALLFFSTNGDRIVVSRFFGPEELAWFSVAFMLTQMTLSLVDRSLQVLFLPWLAKVQSDEIDFRRRATVVYQVYLLAGLVISAAFYFAGPLVVQLFYGLDYMPAVNYLLLLAIVQALRIASGGAVVAALAQGHSQLPLYITMMRVVYVALVALSVWQFELSIPQMIGLTMFSELVVLLLAYRICQNRGGAALRPMFSGLVFAIACFAASLFIYTQIPRPFAAIEGFTVLQLIPVGLLLATPFVMPAAYWSLLRQVKDRLKSSPKSS